MAQSHEARYFYYHRFPTGEIGFLWQKEGLLALDISQLKIPVNQTSLLSLQGMPHGDGGFQWGNQDIDRDLNYRLATIWERDAKEIIDLSDLSDFSSHSNHSKHSKPTQRASSDSSERLIYQAISELSAYFAGTLQQFTIPLLLKGTPFQQKVWQTLITIPYGKVASYREVADMIGQSRATRAVGSANGKNPLPIIIPCHRVIASDGSLGGYSGGLITKIALLEQEGFTITAEKKRLRVVPRESVLFQE